METFMLIANLSMVSTLVIIVFGLAKFRLITTELKLLLALAVVSFSCDAAAFILVKWGINNYSGSAYTLIEFVLVLVIYYKTFNNPNLSMAFLTVGVLYVLFFVFNLLFIQRQQINSYTSIASSFIFIVLAVGFFYQLMKELPALKVYRMPMYWINVGFLLFFSGNFFVFTLSDYLVTILKDDLIVYWSVHNFLSIVKNILLAVGFYWSTKPPQVFL